MPMTDVLAICVCYHNDDEVATFVRGVVSQQAALRKQVLVVNNSDRQYSCPQTKAVLQDSGGLILEPGRNLGYYGAAHCAYCWYTTVNARPEWVLVSNTDVELAGDFFEKLRLLHSEEPPAVLAPALVSEVYGVDQNPFMASHPGRLWLHLKRWMLASTPSYEFFVSASKMRWRLRGQWPRQAKEAPGTPYQIFAPHGALALFHRRYFEVGGSLEPPTFMYTEEMMVAETARRHRLSILYDPRLRARHHHRKPGAANGALAEYQREAAAYITHVYFPLLRWPGRRGPSVL